MLSRETTNTNLIVFGLTRLGLKPMIYCTLGEHTNHYTTDAVFAVITIGGLLYVITSPITLELKKTNDKFIFVLLQKCGLLRGDYCT